MSIEKFRREVIERINREAEKDERRLKKRNKALLYLDRLGDLADGISYSAELAADKLDDGEKRNREDGLQACLEYVAQWRRECESLEAELREELEKHRKKKREKTADK